LGENFGVNVEDKNEEGVDFYILSFTKTSFIVEEPFTYPWGQRFHASDIVNSRKHYQSWGQIGSS